MISKSCIRDIQKILQYKFVNIENLKNSLVHPSIFVNYKKSKDKHYKKDSIYEFERLEFLGDRVLGLVVASMIFNKFKNYNEGKLSKKFSYLVQRDFLYNIALEINLENYLEFNKQKKSNTSVNKSILADSFESLIGSIFVDGGYQKSYSFIERIWSPYLDELISDELDSKSKLQEISQKKYKKLPEYSLIKREGSPHSPMFTISLDALNFNNIIAKGNSIRDAEKKAAKKLLSLLNEK